MRNNIHQGSNALILALLSFLFSGGLGAKTPISVSTTRLYSYLPASARPPGLPSQGDRETEREPKRPRPPLTLV